MACWLSALRWKVSCSEPCESKFSGDHLFRFLADENVLLNCLWGLPCSWDDQTATSLNITGEFITLTPEIWPTFGRWYFNCRYVNKKVHIFFKFHYIMFLRVTLTISQRWFRPCFVLKAVSHYLNHHKPTRQMHVHGPLARYVKLRVAHAPGMPGTFSPPPLVSDPDMHHGRCVTHVPWCMPGSLTSGFLWSRCRGKRSRHSRRMRNPQFCVSGKRPIAWLHRV